MKIDFYNNEVHNQIITKGQLKNHEHEHCKFRTQDYLSVFKEMTFFKQLFIFF